MTRDRASIMELHGITKVYRLGQEYIKAVADITLTITAGEFVCIMGPSGCGKSTLLHILGCLDRPTSGRYAIRGRDIQCLTDDELSDIRNADMGFVFQQFHLLPKETLLENVETAASYSKARRSRQDCITVLESLGLGDRLHHFPSQVSGGEKQRAALARALINDPSIILADEPTGNLDSAAGLHIMRLLTQINRQGRTIVLVTHDHGVARHAQRIVRMMDGAIAGIEEA